ncbi:MAG: hypothetical protein VX642_08375 [Bdellovibrionota bacterium]|nr:hypothetical protein [Bdellovibrionota bacterium]
MIRIVLLSFFLLNPLLLQAQKQAVEFEVPEEAESTSEPSTEVKPQDSSVIVNAPTVKDFLKLDLELFNKMDRPIPLVALLKKFESLECKSSFASPLILTCFTCGIEHDSYQWIFEFSKNSVGGELCDLSRVKRISRKADDFAKAKSQFKKNLAKKHRIQWTTVTNLDSAATKDKDFQVIERQSFDLDENDFVNEQVLQLSFLSYMMNQAQIDQAKESWQRARMSFSKAAWNDFGTYLFSEDSGEIQSKNLELLRELMRPQTTEETPAVAEDEEIKDPITLQKAKYLPLIKSLVFYYDGKNNIALKESYYQLFQLLPKIELTKEEAKYFEGFKFLELEKVEAKSKEVQAANETEKDDKSKVEMAEQATSQEQPAKEEKSAIQSEASENYVLKWKHELKENEQKLQIPIFKALQKLAIQNDENLVVSCDDREKNFLDFEKDYQSFYKGKEDISYYKMYRAYLVVQLLEYSEMKYFEFLSKQRALVELEAPEADLLKEYSEKLEESLARVEDYSEELQQLMPYLEDSIRLRKEWLLRGIKSSEVFNYCVVKK